MSHSAIDIARFLLKLAGEADENESQPLTNLHLQKLLYLAQGWHLALYGSPLFDDRIEAWKHGPVTTSVNARYHTFGKDPIVDDEPHAPLTDATESLVRQVWQRYRDLSAVGLSKETHRHKPWQEAWDRRRDAERGNEQVSHEAMREFFKTLDWIEHGPLTAEAVDRARRELDAGQFVTLEGLERELLPK